MPRCASRSMKSSETTPSSRSATLVSWGVLLTMRSLVMEGPFNHSGRPAPRGDRRAVHEPFLAPPPRHAEGHGPPARTGAAADSAGRPAGKRAGGVLEE